MIYIAWFILIFTLLQFLIAATNLIFLQRFPKINQNSNQLVSVLIPARNEEKNIAGLLYDLQNQDFENIEIIVFNDHSTDQTETIVNSFAEKDKRIKLIKTEGLPEGWLGKNHACYNLAKHANGKYFLFLDADVSVAKNIIHQTLAFSEKYNLGLLTIFPMQIMKTIGEKISVPNMNYILLSLLPLILVRKTGFPSIAAANGQFMLFNAEVYEKMQPHKKLKKSKVEDIEIARYFKQNNITVACLTGTPSITCRMYSDVREAIQGFSKNVIMFFGSSFVLALLFWLLTTYGFIVILTSFSPLIFWIFLVIIFITRAIISVVSKQPVFQNILLIIPQQIILGIFIYQAFINKIKKQHIWKDRNIS